MGFFDFFSKEKKEKLDQGLTKTKESLFSKITKAVVGKDKVDEEVLDELEEILIGADVGIQTTVKIIKAIEERVSKDKYLGASELDIILKEEVEKLLLTKDKAGTGALELLPGTAPYVIMVVGVNGVGKTTTIGKLASQFHRMDKKVVLGAADTFRAAAVEQLKLWGARTGVPVIEHGMNTDPASVAFDAVKKAKEIGADVVIIDTAGRLHNKVGLMNELTKIKRVIQKFIPEAPHEVLLVLDGSTGQNALTQAQEFSKATDITALAITKLDGTAKGGVVIGISDQLSVPVKYIGVGEKIDDLQLFNTKEFVDSLFSREKK
ncbi:MAG: signal recognition particle-docking protein FtsY [Flexibacteraceae bacterium]